jgi:integrase
MSELGTDEVVTRWEGDLAVPQVIPHRLIASSYNQVLSFIDMPAFMEEVRAIDGMAARALEFTILTATWTSEVAGIRWLEVDLASHVWTVPAKRTKLKTEHRVALSSSAIAILRRLAQERAPRPDDFIFFSREPVCPLSTASLTQVLRRLGLRDRSTVHGFRAAFRDWVVQASMFSERLAQAALADKIESRVERVYWGGGTPVKQFAMMNAWGDFCAGRGHRPALRAV